MNICEIGLIMDIIRFEQTFCLHEMFIFIVWFMTGSLWLVKEWKFKNNPRIVLFSMTNFQCYSSDRKKKHDYCFQQRFSFVTFWILIFLYMQIANVFRVFQTFLYKNELDFFSFCLTANIEYCALKRSSTSFV